MFLDRVEYASSTDFSKCSENCSDSRNLFSFCCITDKLFPPSLLTSITMIRTAVITADHAVRMREHVHCTDFGGMDSLMEVVLASERRRQHIYYTAESQANTGSTKVRKPFDRHSGLYTTLKEVLLEVEAKRLLEQNRNHASSIDVHTVTLSHEDVFDDNEEEEEEGTGGGDTDVYATSRSYTSGSSLTIAHDGVSLLTSNLTQVDDEMHYRQKSYTPPTFVPISHMLVFDDSLKRHNTATHQRKRSNAMSKTSRILSPILRAYFSLLHFGKYRIFV